MRDPPGRPAHHQHARGRVTRVVHHHAVDALRAPARLRLLNRRCQSRQRRGLAAGCAHRPGGHGFGGDGHAPLARAVESGQRAPRHVLKAQDHQAAVDDHEMKGQRQHRQRVVRVQPTAPPLAGAEGEEVGEQLLVHHHAADHGHHTQQRGEAHDPAAPLVGHVVQLVVEAVEELAARRGASGARRGRGAVVGLLPRAGRAAPVGGRREAARIRQFDAPARGAGRGAGQVRGDAIAQRGHVHLAGLRRRLGLHPGRELFAVEGQAARPEHGVEHPGGQQARPGVQPGHARAHAAARARPGREHPHRHGRGHDEAGQHARHHAVDGAPGEGQARHAGQRSQAVAAQRGQGHADGPGAPHLTEHVHGPRSGPALRSGSWRPGAACARGCGSRTWCRSRPASACRTGCRR
ncbi:hypothetical protein BN948_04725 [Hydrogenophaga intermedia]|uniref:Uncharacterized protein n=1 Tax=Hydrogenophaga intermedia TaxID=65786 RepID=A0A1L1PRA6_HYDIT|nr:hypothetical protein BN948_04725 [Hydrogenophaga intermedia]